MCADSQRCSLGSEVFRVPGSGPACMALLLTGALPAGPQVHRPAVGPSVQGGRDVPTGLGSDA